MSIKYKIVALPPHMALQTFDRNRRLTDEELRRLQEQVNGLARELRAKPDIQESFESFRFLFSQVEFTLPSIKQILHVCFSDYFELLERYLTDAHFLAVQYRNRGLNGKQGRENNVTPIINRVAQVFFEALSTEETAFAKTLVLQAQRIFKGELRIEQRVAAVSYMVEPQDRSEVAAYIGQIKDLKTEIEAAVKMDLSFYDSAAQALDDLSKWQINLNELRMRVGNFGVILDPLFSKMEKSLEDKKEAIVLQVLTEKGWMPAGQVAPSIEGLTAQARDIRTRLEQAGQGMDGLLAAVDKLLQTGDESPDPSEIGDSLVPLQTSQVSTYTDDGRQQLQPGLQGDGTFVTGEGTEGELKAVLDLKPLAGIGTKVPDNPLGAAADVEGLKAGIRTLEKAHMLVNPRSVKPVDVLSFSGGMKKADVPAVRQRVMRQLGPVLKRLQQGYLTADVRGRLCATISDFYRSSESGEQSLGMDLMRHNPVPDVGEDELDIADKRKLASFLEHWQFRKKVIFHFDEVYLQEGEDVVMTLKQERRQVAAAFNQEISTAVDNDQHDYAQVLTKLKIYFERETAKKIEMVEGSLEEGTEVLDIVFAKLKFICPVWAVQNKEEFVMEFSANGSQVLELDKEAVLEFLQQISADKDFPFILSEIDDRDYYAMIFGEDEDHGEVLYLKDCVTHWEVAPSLELSEPIVLDDESDTESLVSAGSDDVEMGLTGSDDESDMELDGQVSVMVEECGVVDGDAGDKLMGACPESDMDSLSSAAGGDAVEGMELTMPDTESDDESDMDSLSSAGSDDVEGMESTGSDTESAVVSVGGVDAGVIALSPFEGEIYEFGVAVTNFQEIMSQRLSGQGTDLELRQLGLGDFCHLWLPEETESGRLRELIPVAEFNPENLEVAHAFLVAFLRKGFPLVSLITENSIIRSIFGRPQAADSVTSLLCFDLDKKGGELWALVLRNWFLACDVNENESSLLNDLKKAYPGKTDQEVMMCFIQECLKTPELGFRED
ncbi:hypothetical protein HOG75_00930, partial [bacterium]|nr:hypothetical protein [bacterium]